MLTTEKNQLDYILSESCLALRNHKMSIFIWVLEVAASRKLYLTNEDRELAILKLDS